MRNLKTTIAGILIIAGVIGKFLSDGDLGLSEFTTLTAGIGLIVAKDHNTTGAAH
jgi:hypothetical protein